MTSISFGASLKEAFPVILGAVSAVVGFILMRVSAIFESWILLFVSFGLMMWGIMALFTGSWRPSADAFGSDT